MEEGARTGDHEFCCDEKLHPSSQKLGCLNKEWTILSQVDIPPDTGKFHRDSYLEKELQAINNWRDKENEPSDWLSSTLESHTCRKQWINSVGCIYMFLDYFLRVYVKTMVKRSPVSLGGSRGVKDMGAIRERRGNDVIIL